MDFRDQRPPISSETSSDEVYRKGTSKCIGFAQMEANVRHEIERSSSSRRLMVRTLPRYSQILNGLRPGELTVFTGPTGCGKTTVLSQISLDYCMQGVRVLWGSFEIKNTRLAQVMLQQVAMQPLVPEHPTTSAKQVSPEEIERRAAVYDSAASKLRSSPIQFIDCFGSTSLDTVLSILYDSFALPGSFRPHLVILDNLQFMLSGQASNSLDRWDLMERAIAALRQFCNVHPVHVILVVHPRKELDDSMLSLASVSGTAKATQEADNVVILQKIGDRRILDVRKNRYHGDLGRVELDFLPHARMVVEKANKPVPTSNVNDSSDPVD